MVWGSGELKASLRRTVTGAPQMVGDGEKVVTMPPRPVSLDRLTQQIKDARSNCVQIETQEEHDRQQTAREIAAHMEAIDQIKRERMARSDALRASHADALKVLNELQDKAAHHIRNNMDIRAEPVPRHPLPPVEGT